MISDALAAFRFVRGAHRAPGAADHAFVARVKDEANSLRKLADQRLSLRLLDDLATRSNPRARNDANGLTPIFARVIEAARRGLGIELRDGQILSGLALARGALVELATGEGKTFAILFPACVGALSGRGTHIMTVNAYLAERDHDWLASVYRLLGVTLGLLRAEDDVTTKRAAYARDVTYGPGYEFGFDYLRERLAEGERRSLPLGEAFRRRLRDLPLVDGAPARVRRGTAIVDEADSVMIDEATTPLALAVESGRPAPNADVHRAALAVADRLEFDRHYRIDAGEQTLSLTRLGREQVARWSGEIPKRGLERAWTAYIEQSLRARWLVRPDIHYLISEGRVQHVDSNTGRVFADRSWREGLEQAIQAREGLTITAETRSLASITRQRYFRVYERLCGLTGTARGTEPEMNAIYGMEIVVIPPHRPCLREALPTLAFPTREAKERAVIAEIMGQSRSGRPLLIGTTTIEASERLARKLTERQVSFRLLNGKRPADEAALVASAGQRGVITLATNMAGRGTDITLGPGVVEMGGLHVIASEPHASTRVDRQLMGRAARQGDPGSCRMFVSAEDDLLAREAPALAKRIRRLAPESGLAHDDFSRALVALQRRHERAQAVLRRRLFEHDDWLASAHDDWLTRETDGGN